jgi:hypothetical protein
MVAQHIFEAKLIWILDTEVIFHSLVYLTLSCFTNPLTPQNKSYKNREAL